MQTPLVDDARWLAVSSRDAAFDGRFVFGVRSTGIYCRPSCPSPRARRDRLVYFERWQQAEHAGFRACLRCAPRVHAEADDKRRLDRELRLAALVQSRLRPQAVARPGWDVASAARPCRELGGDTHDVIARADGRMVIALGDVAGKGAGPALLAASLHAAVRAHAAVASDPAAVAQALDAYLAEVTDDREYATLFLGVLDPGSGALGYVSAGHPPALLVRADGTVARLDAGGPPLGLLPDARFEAGDARLAPGDALAVFSDGLTDADGGALDEDDLVALLRDRGPAAGVCERIMAAAEPARASDDQSLIVVRRGWGC